MISLLKRNPLFICLLFGWFLLNLLQSIFTEINPDEAYYVLYGQHLSWGYYDHPPLVALITRTGSLFFTGNLGARIVTVFLQIPTLIITWHLIDVNERGKREILAFFIISASLVMFAVYGFTTTPDVPLLFFTSLFLYAYKKILEKQDWLFILIMGMSMAGLIYSKYQGVLVIGFVFLSNPKLIVTPKLWPGFILAFLLCIPHFYWQYINGFPSIKYQLVDSASHFHWENIADYLPNQVLVFNPFTLGAVIYLLFKYKAANAFERANYFLVTGFISFFWIMTYHRHAEPHWTVAASIPMIILLNNKISLDSRLRQYTFRFIAGSLLLTLVARIVIVTNMLPAGTDISGKKGYYLAVEKIAHNNPVVFSGSFQEPSLYTFFTGNPSSVVSSLNTRKTQFDLWNIQNEWKNKTVFVVSNKGTKVNSYKYANNIIQGFFTDDFQSTNSLIIKFKLQDNSIHSGDTVTVDFTIENPANREINFLNADLPVIIEAILSNRERMVEIKGGMKNQMAVLAPKQKISNQIKFVIPQGMIGEVKIAVCCSSCFGRTLNSDLKKIMIL